MPTEDELKAQGEAAREELRKRIERANETTQRIVGRAVARIPLLKMPSPSLVPAKPDKT